jgi:hypothetical protein
LFFASSGQVGKGLDLLLEIFPRHPDLNLNICSSFKYEKDFCKCFHNELFKTDNIHPIGRILVNSYEYENLMRKCVFCILPSCSEGQAGSVVQCMASGLIPVVTKETGIDTENFGFTFRNDSIEEIEHTILSLSQLPPEKLKELSLRTYEIV